MLWIAAALVRADLDQDAAEYAHAYMQNHVQQKQGLAQHYLSKRATGADAVPTKGEDQWTVTAKFRDDLAGFVRSRGGHEDLTVLEVGSYLGYTTRLLSGLFHRVIALDAIPALLSINRDFNADRRNVVYLQFHTGDGDWGTFAVNRIDAVLLDASHDYEAVVSDIANVLKLPHVQWIAFDDYTAEPGVQAAVQAFVSAGRLSPLQYLGEMEYSVPDGRVIEGPEGIVCAVMRG
jgi:SAM-dependent methyltransferase